MVMRRRPRRMFSLDTALVNEIVEGHEHDQAIDYDVKSLLHLVEDITKGYPFSSEGVSTGGRGTNYHGEGKIQQLSGYNNMLEVLSYEINKISSELFFKALSGADAHLTTLSILKLVRTYKWDVKLVLTLAAFALSYEKYWQLAHIDASKQLPKSLEILKQLPGVMEQYAGSSKPRFDALNILLEVILDVTKCVIEFNDLPHSYITPEVADYSSNASYVIPLAAYWSIRTIVFCATEVTFFTTLRDESVVSTTNNWEIYSWSYKLKCILDHLRKQLDSCYRHIEKKKDDEAYGMLVELFQRCHLDNMKILGALIYAKDNILPLLDGSTKRRVSIDVLRRKTVLLLISGLDFSHNELSILEQIYNDSRKKELGTQYEIVWLPIVEQQSNEWNVSMQRQFERLQSTMPWYSVYHPSLIAKPVNWFVQKEWKYKTKPILVVLDPQGRVLCHNALHMMWIWGVYAFPFTSAREEALWREEALRLELLVDGIDVEILNWINEGKYVILCGSTDIDWVRKFVKAALRVGMAARIPLQMVYIGNRNNWKQVQQVLDTIALEKLDTHYWPIEIMIWFFWNRLESMLFSKIQIQQADDDDIVMQEIKKLLSYEKQDGWFVLAKGSSIVVNGHAKAGLQTLIDYDNMWKEHADKQGFEHAFEQHYRKLHTVASPCCRFELSHAMGRIPDELRCPECQQQMKMLTISTFQCCHQKS